MDSHSSSSSTVIGPVALLKSGWDLFKGNWKVLTPIVIIPSLLSYTGSAFTYLQGPVGNTMNIILALSGGILSVVMMPAFIGAIQGIRTGKQSTPSVVSSYKYGLGYFWSFILIAIINFFVSLGAMILFFIPAIIVGVYVCMYAYTLVIDDKKGFSAFTESYSLVYGRWLAVFGRLLFLGAVSVVAWLILAGIGVLVGLLTGLSFDDFMASGSGGQPSFSAFVASSVLGLLGTAIFVPIAVGYSYEMYMSLKATRSSDVRTSIFKRWLIAFIVIAIVIIPIGGIFAFSFAKKVITERVSQNQDIQEAIQKAIAEQKDPKAAEALKKVLGN